MNEEPIQIIDIDEVRGRLQFKLADELKDILKIAGDADICLISIAGASRLGKSCFLTYLVHYLRHLEEEGVSSKIDWLPPNSSQEVVGFPFKNTVERQTTGFWIWPRPFLIKRPNSTKSFAVFLMDTQGVFDSKTMTEWSAIFGLALLTSSTLIYNLHFIPQEDNLMVLDIFLQYGLIARDLPSQQDDIQAPFQKLFCLVRDWSAASKSYPYGSLGGKQFVDKWLQTNSSNLPPEAVKRRQNIKSCFEKIQGCLLPHPGVKAQSDRFNGATVDLDPEFYSQLKDCIERVCHPENLIANRICGRRAKFQDLLALFENYVTFINRPDAPKAMGYLEVTQKSSCDGAGQYALAHFKEKVGQLLLPGNYMTIKDLTKKLYQLEEESKMLFDQKIKIGLSDTVAYTKGKLTENILLIKSKTIQDYLTNYDAILESLKQEAEDQFRAEFQNFSSQHKYEDTGIPSNQIDKVLKDISINVAEGFDNNPALKDEELAEKFGTILDECLTALKQQSRAENAGKVEDFDNTISQVITKFLDGYETEFAGSMGYLPFQDEKKLIELDRKFRQDSLLKLDKLPVSKIPQNLKPHAKDRLVQEFNQKFTLITKNNSDAILKTKQDLAELVSKIGQDFKNKLHNYISNSSTVPSRKQLDYEFMKRKEEAINNFDLQSQISDLKFINPYKIQLEQEIQQACDDILEEMAEKKDVLQNQVKNWMDAQSTEFKKRLTLSSQSKTSYLEVAEFYELCKKIQTELINKTECQLRSWNILESNHVSTLSTLTKLLKDLSNKESQEYKEMLGLEADKGRSGIDQSVRKYIQDMKSFPAANALNLAKNHATSLAKVRRTFEETLSHLPPTILEDLTSELCQRIDQAFQELQKEKENERRQTEKDINKALTEAIDLYESKMAKKWALDHLSEGELKEQSNSVKKIAIRLFQNQVFSIDKETIDSQKHDLGDTIETLYARGITAFRKNQQVSRESKISQFVQSCTDSYSKKMSKNLQGPIGDTNWFKNCHEFCKSQIIQGIHDHGKAVGITMTAMELENAENDINRKIEEFFQTFLQQFNERQASMLDVLSEFEISAIGEHKATIRRMAEELLVQDDEILDQKNQELAAQSINELNHNFSAINPTKFANANQKLTTAFHDNLSAVKDEYSKKFIKLQEILVSLNSALVKDFEKADDPDWDELSRSHFKRRDTAFQDLSKLCNFPTQELVNDFKTQYNSKTKNLFDDAKTNFKTQEPDLTILNGIMKEMCDLYENEMDKHAPISSGYVDPNRLRIFHYQVAQHVVERLKERKAVKMTQLVKSKLKLKIDAALKRREDANYQIAPTTEVAIGIDLGTTFSCVAIYDKNATGQVRILENAEGKTTTPSYVRINGNEDIVGEVAKNGAFLYPSSTIFDAKRLIGRKYDEPIVQEDIRNWPFTVVRGGNGSPLIDVEGQLFEPEDISAKLLKKLKQDAESKLGKTIANAVITVPAYFSDGQRKATQDAGIEAGFKVLELLNEPTAAAVGYNLEYSLDKERLVLIFDLGGGTFDVAIISTLDANVKNLVVDGNTHLGGEDFDNQLMNYCIQEFTLANPTLNPLLGKDSTNEDLKQAFNRRIRRLRHECEAVKLTLSSATTATVSVAAFLMNDPIALDLVVEVTRQQFEGMNDALFKKCIQIVEDAIKAANINKSQIDEIVIVGGSTKIPKVREMLSAFFGGKALNHRLNPDEAVARGAAIRAAVLCTELKSTLQDVTPLSIGIKVMGGDLSVIIPRNTGYPIDLTKQYHTADDNQEEVQIAIFEGEDTKATQNRPLGTFDLTGIPPEAAGSQRIDVTMSIDRNGILTVTAKCEGNGVTKVLVIEEKKDGNPEQKKEFLGAKTSN